ncbi:hypothetical protein V6N13_091147 [Hibiscus sabdariffa]
MIHVAIRVIQLHRLIPKSLHVITECKNAVNECDYCTKIRLSSLITSDDAYDCLRNTTTAEENEVLVGDVDEDGEDISQVEKTTIVKEFVEGSPVASKIVDVTLEGLEMKLVIVRLAEDVSTVDEQEDNPHVMVLYQAPPLFIPTVGVANDSDGEDELKKKKKKLF